MLERLRLAACQPIELQHALVQQVYRGIRGRERIRRHLADLAVDKPR